jgi:hypothetical protein
MPSLNGVNAVVIRKQLNSGGLHVDVMLKAGDGPRVSGKYLVGRPLLNSSALALAFDDAAEFHKDIAHDHGLRPLGGGWCEIDHAARTVTLSSSSQAFGREPDRARALAWFSECFEGYRCQELD